MSKNKVKKLIVASLGICFIHTVFAGPTQTITTTSALPIVQNQTTSSPLPPGSKVVAGDLSKNEFYILGPTQKSPVNELNKDTQPIPAPVPASAPIVAANTKPASPVNAAEEAKLQVALNEMLKGTETKPNTNTMPLPLLKAKKLSVVAHKLKRMKKNLLSQHYKQPLTSKHFASHVKKAIKQKVHLSQRQSLTKITLVTPHKKHKTHFFVR